MMMVKSVKMGFQPSSLPAALTCPTRRMFRHTLPSRLMLGWYSLVSASTAGGAWGYMGSNLTLKRMQAPFHRPSCGRMLTTMSRMFLASGNSTW
jgi:hypothetical protein